MNEHTKNNLIRQKNMQTMKIDCYSLICIQTIIQSLANDDDDDDNDDDDEEWW